MGRADHVIDLRAEHESNRFIQQTPGLRGVGQPSVRRKRLLAKSFKQWHLLQLIQGNQAGANTIVNVVGVVGNFVCHIAQLRLQAGLRPIQEALPNSAATIGIRQLTSFQRDRIFARTVFEYPFPRLKTQVQAVKIRVTLLQMIDHPQALQVVLKATELDHAFMQRVLSCMAKRGVTQVVRQGNGFDQVLVEPKRPGNGATQLRHFQ